MLSCVVRLILGWRAQRWYERARRTLREGPEERRGGGPREEPKQEPKQAT